MIINIYLDKKTYDSHQNKGISYSGCVMIKKSDDYKDSDEYINDLKICKETIRDKDIITVKIIAHGNKNTSNLYDEDNNVVDKQFIYDVFRDLELDNNHEINLIFIVCYGNICTDGNISVVDEIHSKLKKDGYKNLKSEGGQSVVTFTKEEDVYNEFIYKNYGFFIDNKDTIKNSIKDFPWFYYYITNNDVKFSALPENIQDENDETFRITKDNIISSVENYFVFINHIRDKNEFILYNYKNYPTVFLLNYEEKTQIEELFQIIENNWLILINYIYKENNFLINDNKINIESRRESNKNINIYDCYNDIDSIINDVNNTFDIIENIKDNTTNIDDVIEKRNFLMKYENELTLDSCQDQDQDIPFESQNIAENYLKILSNIINEFIKIMNEFIKENKEKSPKKPRLYSNNFKIDF